MSRSRRRVLATIGGTSAFLLGGCSFLDGRSSKAWTVEADGGTYTAPATADGIAYVTTQSGGVYAIDAVSGETDWKINLDVDFASKPTLTAEEVYIGTSKGVFELSRGTGEIQWQQSNATFVAAPPQVRDETIYVATREGTVSAIARGTKALQWEYTTGNDILYAPRVSQNSLYVASTAGNVYKLDVETGDEGWMTTLGEALRTRPLLTSNGLFIAHNATGKVRQMSLHDGTTIWTHSQEPGCNTPIRANGRIYTTNHNNGDLESYEPDDGRRKHIHESDAAFVTPPTISDGKAFVGASTNVVAEISLSTGNELTSHSLGGLSEAQPAVTSNHVIFTTGEVATIEAFDRTE